MNAIKQFSKTHIYVIARSIFSSIHFYTRFGFKLFNYIELETYITGKYDENLTAMLNENVEKVHKELQKRSWVPCGNDGEECDFFPIIALTTVGEEIAQRKRIFYSIKK